MSEPKDTTSFFRKVVKFVANPTTEWADLGAAPDESRETELARNELKAMIERKRRNDFVRKREFDLLRKVRREGLSSEQLAALGGASRLDDSEVRVVDSMTLPDGDVKAKIDQIEQQMVGDSYLNASTPSIPPRRPLDFYAVPTSPAAPGAPAGDSASDPGQRSARAHAALANPAAPNVTGAGLTPLSSMLALHANTDFAHPYAADFTDVAHDPDLDEAVIAFANADFEPCELSLITLTRAGGLRARHAETWLVLFDLYRAIGQQAKFEALALDYAGQFGWSAPQWFSLPQLVGDAQQAAMDASRVSTSGLARSIGSSSGSGSGSADDRRARAQALDAQVGWVCPAHVDAEAVARLAAVSLQLPPPWVFDWAGLSDIDALACARLSDLFRSWMPQRLEMRWLGGERLFAVLAQAAPNGRRDADPAFWQLRLDALRMTNRPDQFDEVAIDYCITYEVSPPSWEAVRCDVRVASAGGTTSTAASPLSIVTGASSSFLESLLVEDAGMVQVGTVALSGQLVGDISATLRQMDLELGAASIINVSCARLIRVDFIAAGDLLNWVLARHAENRSVAFFDAHRMVALFFGAMGINEHARVKVRNF